MKKQRKHPSYGWIASKFDPIIGPVIIPTDRRGFCGVDFTAEKSFAIARLN
jgi:hypothetical protein